MASQSVSIYKEVFSVLLVLILVFVVAELYYTRALQTQCWRDTMTELDIVTSPVSMGYAKCVGKDEFTMMLSMKSCVNSIEFTDYIGCLKECKDEIGQSDTDNIMMDTCLTACKVCKNNKGCIIAIPRISGDLLSWERFQSNYNNVSVWPVINHGFIGDTSFQANDNNLELNCVEFSKDPNGDTYKVSKDVVNEKGDCKVSKCI